MDRELRGYLERRLLAIEQETKDIRNLLANCPTDQPAPVFTEKPKEHSTGSFLSALGVPATRKGRASIIAAIEMIQRDPDMIYRSGGWFMDMVCLPIGEKFGISKDGVRKNIENAIHHAFSHRIDEELFRTVCSESGISHSDSPSPADFLVALYNFIKNHPDVFYNETL